ncbi:MAG: sensor histidine kinase [Rubrobacteraceae bacterium]
MQFSRAKTHLGGSSHAVLAAVLVFWATLAAVFGLLPPGSLGRVILVDAGYGAAAIFVLAATGRAVWLTAGRERLFWGLLGGGLLLYTGGYLTWILFQSFSPATENPLALQVIYLISYLLLLGGLLCLVQLVTRGITLVTALDATAIVLSVGTLVYFFVLGSPGPGMAEWQVSLGILSRPAFDSALLYLSLVTLSLVHRPAFTNYLALGFLAFLVADLPSLAEVSEGTSGFGGWPGLIYALGLVLLGFGALRATPAVFAPQQRIAPWRVLTFWFGPLSPPLHFGLLMLWGVFDPPLPAYVYVGVTAVLLYLAGRVALVSFVSQKLTREQEDLARRLEQNRILRELHETVKQDVHGISLTLGSALEAQRRGDRGTARETLSRAFRISREAEYRISRPYDELNSLQEDGQLGPDDFLRSRLEKFEEYFGIKTHEDLRASLDVLSSAEFAAATRVFVEAMWNVAKHSRARNAYLESRRVGNVFIFRIRDDGRGFDANNPPPGMGLRYLKQRAAEVEAMLDVISTPGRGTTIQLRFNKKART